MSTYNEEEKPKKKVKRPSMDTMIEFDCAVKGFLEGAYGKYGTRAVDSQVIMEYN